MSGVRYAQFCALARAVELLGERWTLLIIRELLLGPARFGDLLARLHGVSPTLLTSRLGQLAEHGILRRATLPPPANVHVYELTDVGQDLRPAIHALIRWGGHFLFPPRPDDRFEPDWVRLALEAIARTGPTPDCRIGLRIPSGGKVADVVVTGGPSGTTVAAGTGSTEPMIEAPFDVLLRIIAGAVSLDDAVDEQGAVVRGACKTAARLPDLFDLRRRRET